VYSKFRCIFAAAYRKAVMLEDKREFIESRYWDRKREEKRIKFFFKKICRERKKRCIFAAAFEANEKAEFL
jgi:hypothetical protein